MNNKLILLAVMVLAGCSVMGSTMAQLQASHWQLQGANSDTFTLQVTDGKVAGKGGCNRYFGKLSQQGEGLLKVSSIGVTRMMCMGALAAEESAYLQKLEQVSAFKVSGQQLVLSDANNVALLTFNAVAGK
ncbi:META domain-containing protein [Aeromonas cavernicola]|uniref:META domain-containing protein n=1 Tax=Aeromonas cavernicola TaxID=1006623 RepID=A0A2H9U7I3_9GAMM|nr:META domain-containing protein [Aeromonas cavernicola]PJG59962.1 META domain-containing protein [Aeromonas cavernicola]